MTATDNAGRRCTCEVDPSITCIVHPHAKHPRAAPGEPCDDSDYCSDCKGSGEVMGLIQPGLDPQDSYEYAVTCPKCEGTGTAAPEFGGVAEPALTPTFQQVWAKLQPVERAIISAQFMEPSRCNPHPPADDEAMGRDEYTPLRLLCDLRFALGDNGKRMQPELVEYAAELARDAARYRWLRACDLAGEQRVMTADGRELKTGNDLDAAIDAAMRGTAEKAGEGAE